MKRVWWVAKVAVLVAASYCIFNPGGIMLGARADDGGGGGGSCDTSYACARNSSNNSCYCTIVVIGGSGGCSGCYIPSNDTGCGKCSGGPNILD